MQQLRHGPGRVGHRRHQGADEQQPASLRFAPGGDLLVYLAGSSWMKKAHLGAPLLALIVGLLLGNVIRLPEWFKTSLRTEYYIKTGIVLLGATLPLTLIFRAGWVAFLQATIVSVGTWLDSEGREQKVEYQYKGGIVDFVKHLNATKEPLFSKVFGERRKLTITVVVADIATDFALYSGNIERFPPLYSRDA